MESKRNVMLTEHRKEVILRTVYTADEPKQYGEKLISEVVCNLSDPESRKRLLEDMARAIMGNHAHTMYGAFCKLEMELRLARAGLDDDFP